MYKAPLKTHSERSQFQSISQRSTLCMGGGAGSTWDTRRHKAALRKPICPTVSNSRCSAFHQKESRKKSLRPERSPGRHGPVSCTGLGSESPCSRFSWRAFLRCFRDSGQGLLARYGSRGHPGWGGEACPSVRADRESRTQLGDGEGDAAGRERLQCADLAGARAAPAKAPSLARIRGGRGSREPTRLGSRGATTSRRVCPRLHGRGRSRARWLPGRAESGAVSLPTARSRCAAAHLPSRLRSTPQVSDPATTGRTQPRWL